jgi:hypothetical protein
MNTGHQPTHGRTPRDSALLDLPSGAGATVEFNPGLGRPLRRVQVTLVCLVANNNFLPGEEIPIEGRTRNAGATSEPGITHRFSATKVTVTRNVASVDIFTGTAWPTLTAGEWGMRIRCS